MDPLTIGTAVPGLLVTAGQLIVALNSLATSIKDAAKDATAAATELSSITIVVQGLQVYVDEKVRASPQRLQLITIEQITATLTGCIMTSDELNATLKSLHADGKMTVWDRAKWLLKKEQVTGLTQRLQSHKATFTMMLNIIQCASMSEAERNMDHLRDTVNQLLASNRDLSMRLRNIETTQQTNYSPAAEATLGALSQDPDDGSVRSVTRSLSSDGSDATARGPALEITIRPSAFEEQLHRSRLYRHAAANHSESSLTNDARSTLALSICSSLTLGDVSKISVYALPIYAAELSGGHAYAATVREPPSQPTVVPGSGPKTALDGGEPTLDKRRGLRRLWGEYRGSKPPPGNKPNKPPSAPVRDQGPPIFGVPLAASIRYANVAISLFDDDGQPYTYGYVPIVVAKCGVFLKERATDVEYIFEMSGSPIRVKALQTIFDTPDRYGKGHNWVGYDVHDAANIFLRYFLQLPEPVVPLEWYDRFRDPLRLHFGAQNGLDTSLQLSDSDHSVAIKTYQVLIKGLPALQRQLFTYLLDILAVFASKSHVNMMTTVMLASIFQPGVLNHPMHKLAAKETRHSRDVLVFLIENQDNFLIGLDTT